MARIPAPITVITDDTRSSAMSTKLPPASARIVAPAIRRSPTTSARAKR